jgi:hypothetical protein
MGLISALLWAAQVKDAQPQQRQGQNGTEWFLPALEGKRAGFFLQKFSPPNRTAATATNLRYGIFSSLDRA